jgi:hypothetical protein
MSLFRSLFSPGLSGLRVSCSAQRKRPKACPEVELLEDRTLLNATPTKFVVAPGQTLDGSHFATLAGALAAAVNNDVIQIEPGSTPGSIVNANVPALANLTIQGDVALAGGLAGIPAFLLTDAPGATGTVHAGNTLTLTNINLGLTGSGELEFVGSGNISNSTISDLSSSATSAVLFNEGANTSVNSVTNTIFAQQGGTGAPLNLVQVNISSTNPNSNTFTGNTFVANASMGNGILLDYSSTFGTPSVAVTDKVSNNTFVANQGADLAELFLDQAVCTGLTVQGNTFVATDTSKASTAAISLNPDPNGVAASASILNNVINMTGQTPIGVFMTGAGTSGSSNSFTINNNQISTGGTANGGTGISITQGTAGVAVTVTAQGNDFHNNQTGVAVAYNATGPSPTIDLGGGGTSTGGNNFRSTPAAGAAAGAIIATGTNPAAAATINAQQDIFSGSPNVSTNGLANVSIVTTSPLTGNAAFVQVVYQDLLGRTGNLSSNSDAGGWVSALNAGTMNQASVARGIALSTEALDRFVNGLYLRLLHRTADATGLAGWVGLIQSSGTIEQVIQGIVSSPEYASLYPSDFAYVQSLYTNLLGRVGSAAEVQSWLNVLPALGRAGVAAGFTSSVEFRTNVVTQFYGAPSALTTLGQAKAVFSLAPNLLHRGGTPTASEVSGWVNSRLSLGLIELGFLSSPEFFSNG